MTLHIATWTAMTGVGATVHGMLDELEMISGWAMSQRLEQAFADSQPTRPRIPARRLYCRQQLRFERGQVTRRTLRRLLDETVQRFNEERRDVDAT